MLGLALTALTGSAAPAHAAIDIKLATVAPDNTPWSDALRLLVKNINAGTQGEANVRLFLASQLGGELEILDGVKLKTIEMGGISTGSMAAEIPELNVFELPFTWNSSEECYYVLDKVMLPEIQKLFESKGFVAIGWSENGWRHFHTVDKPVNTPEDLAGLKIRSQQNKYHLEFFKALRANARPIGMTEVFNSLQTGQVNAGENSLVLTAATGWAEIIKYVSLTGHIYQPAVIFTKKETWDSWPENVRKVILAEANKAQDDTRRRLTEMEPQLVEIFKARGIQVNEISPENRKLFMEKTAVVKDKFREEFKGGIGERLLNLIEEGKAEYAAKNKK